MDHRQLAAIRAVHADGLARCGQDELAPAAPSTPLGADTERRIPPPMRPPEPPGNSVLRRPLAPPIGTVFEPPKPIFDTMVLMRIFDPR